MTRTWSRQLNAIRAAARKRSPFGLEDEDPGLVAAARKFYGGWYEALRAAGVWSPKDRSGYRWTKPDLAAALRRRVRAGHSMRPVDVRREANHLYRASRKLFGSWREAAKAAGYFLTGPSWRTRRAPGSVRG